MFVIRHAGFKSGMFLNIRISSEFHDGRRGLDPSIWSDDITKAISFEFKDEVDQYVHFLRETIGYPVEAVLTFGIENTQ
jgi:hypothetical protein